MIKESELDLEYSLSQSLLSLFSGGYFNSFRHEFPRLLMYDALIILFFFFLPARASLSGIISILAVFSQLPQLRREKGEVTDNNRIINEAKYILWCYCHFYRSKDFLFLCPHLRVAGEQLRLVKKDRTSPGQVEPLSTY